jgi:hypothetical protein
METARRQEWGSVEEVFRIAVIAASDTGPSGRRFDFAYLHAVPPDNERSVLDRGATLFHEKETSLIGILNGGAYRGKDSVGTVFYRGGDAWTEELKRRGVPVSSIFFLNACEPCLKRGEPCHTGTEAVELVRAAKEKGWKDVAITTTPFHMLRAFTNVVTQTLKQYPALRVWCRVGTPLPWNERVISSQDLVTGVRSREILLREFEKLGRVYGNQYDLVSAADVLSYIERRGG